MTAIDQSPKVWRRNTIAKEMGAELTTVTTLQVSKTVAGELMTPKTKKKQETSPWDKPRTSNISPRHADAPCTDPNREKNLLSKRNISLALELKFPELKFSGIFPRTGSPIAHPRLLAIRPENLSTSRLTQLSHNPNYGLSTEAIGSTRQIHARSYPRAVIFRHNRPSIIPIKRKIRRSAYPSTSRVNETRYHARSTHQPARRATATKQLLDGSFPSFIPINRNLYSTKRIVFIEWKVWLLVTVTLCLCFPVSPPFHLLHLLRLPSSIPLLFFLPILSLSYNSCQRTKPRRYYIIWSKSEASSSSPSKVIVLSFFWLWK